MSVQIDKLLLEVEQELESISEKNIEDNKELLERISDGDLANTAYGKKIRSLKIKDVI